MNDPHPSSAALAHLSAHDILQRLAAGGLSSLDLIDTLIERVEQIDSPESNVALNSIAALSLDARSVARERDEERARGVSRGKLHGVPVLIKDNIEAIGLPGVAGSTALAGRPSRDAALVTRLRESGAILFGSTNLSQWANIRSPRSTSGYSASAGLVANPWALDRSAGGSSSGSGAAVAAGLAPLAVGTETDGSIVAPASVNGIVGLKPTVGVVPTTHVVPISASQDSPGPMGRNVNDVALLYGVLAASEPPAPPSTTPTMVAAMNWRTGQPKADQLFDDVLGMLKDGGLTVTERDLALPGPQEDGDELTVLLSELADDFSAYLADRPGSGVSSLADVITFEDEHRDVEQAYFGHELFVQALETGGRGGPNYADARQRNLAWAVDTCLTPGLADHDVVISLSFGPSWKSDLTVGGHPGPASTATTPAAIAGWPILSMPIGLVDGLPVGLAILGRANAEWTILEAARTIERILRAHAPWPTPLWREPTRG